MRKFTEEELDALKTRNGGYDAKTLKMIGVPWPPPKGWRQALLKGEPIPANVTDAGKKRDPITDFIERHGNGDGSGSHSHTCASASCGYPNCACLT